MVAEHAMGKNSCALIHATVQRAPWQDKRLMFQVETRRTNTRTAQS